MRVQARPVTTPGEPLINSSSYYDLISGRRKTLGAGVLRGVLRLLEFPYRWGVKYRNGRYDRDRALTLQPPVPVVCIGNLTLGGTGKTPMVKWVASWCQEEGVRVAIASRGYGSRDDGPNDEALELATALPGVPHVQNRDRVAAVAEAVQRGEAELVVLDDGFQHRRLGRNLDVVLLDAWEPFGLEHLFPRGLLREPIESLCRADVVVLSRSDMLDEDARDVVRQRVAQIAPEAVWCEVTHRPTRLVNHSGQHESLDRLTQGRVDAFCGIGNPAGFRHTLESVGCQPVGWHTFADHHEYGPKELRLLQSMVVGAEMAVCTRKDLVKLNRDVLAKVPVWAVEIELCFLQGKNEMEAALCSAIRVNANVVD